MKSIRRPADKFIILDPNLEKTIDMVTMVLLHYNRHSVLPEILEVFGTELTIKFLDIFGGTTVKVPSRDSLHSCVRDVNVYLRLKAGSATVEDLAHDYQLDKMDIKRIYLSSKQIIEGNMGMKPVSTDGLELLEPELPEAVVETITKDVENERLT